MSTYLRDVFAQTRGRFDYGPNADRAGLARLRRLRPRADRTDRIDPSPLAEAWQVRPLLAALDLFTDDEDAGHDAASYRLERAAAAMGALAEIRTPTKVHPAKALSGVMSEGSFVRLLRMDTPAERLATGRRVVRLLGGAADPGRLGADLYAWSPLARARWAFLYHGASVPDALADQPSGQTPDHGDAA